MSPVVLKLSAVIVSMHQAKVQLRQPVTVCMAFESMRKCTRCHLVSVILD